MKTVLLTGGTGFLGSHIARRLASKQNVIILKRSFSDTVLIKDVMAASQCYDIDAVSLEQVFSDHQINCIVHTATAYGRQGHSYSHIVDSNIGFPLRLLDAALLYHVPCFVNTDTFSAKARHSYSFLKEYNLSKHHLLEWLQLISDQILVINMRLEHMYGPGDTSKKFIPFVIQRMLSNEKNIDLTDGKQKRDFIYVDDVVDAYEMTIDRLCNADKGFHQFEIGTGIAISIRELVESVKECTSSETDLNFGALPHRVGEIMHSEANIRELASLGWKPSTSLNQGLKKTIDYYRKG